MENTKVAIVLGATGLVGKQLVKLLIKDKTFTKIKVFVRRSTNILDEKIEEHIINFGDTNSYKSEIKGDVLFSCLGTTIKQAGSKNEQYKVDFTYQYDFAQIAANNGVSNYVLVSSTSASSKSRIFYSRIKGELEDAISELSFKKISIIRPSVLVGEREESRSGEIIASKVFNVVGKIAPFLNKYRPIKGEEVALALINSFKKSQSDKIVIAELEGVFDLYRLSIKMSH